MAWSYGPDSPPRDTSISAEEEAARHFGTPEVLPWRSKLDPLRRVLRRLLGKRPD